MGKFHYLKVGLGVVLSFVGLKMLVSEYYHIPIGLSLAVVGVVLGASIVASLLWPPAVPSSKVLEEAEK
jgi:tellurite resistance protein TerC